MKQPKLELYSPEELIEKLPELEEKWQSIKNLHKNPKQIEIQFKTLKSLLRKTQVLSNKNSWIDGFNANDKYLILRYSLTKMEISYEELTLAAPPSDKIKIFLEHCNKFSDEQYWAELAYAYTQQNYKKIPYKTYYKLFSANRQNKELLMNPQEQEFLVQLPERITIFRGGSLAENKSKKYGISWSLSRKIAENFANVKKIRDGKEMIVMEKEINKSEVIAYFNHRQEEEIIYLSV